ncbi:hypothetical protein ABT160_05690 [Streptomyces sp. NPDC001941]|uniref:hypothetical protein n=1 Tax=Streptomyces sp. NPDC001941 TaxID=3154659 RepID=UPI0033329BEB
MIQKLMRYAEAETVPGLIAGAVLLLSTPALVVAVLCGRPAVFAAACAAGLAADAWVHRAEPALVRALGRFKWGLGMRSLARHAALALLLATVPGPHGATSWTLGGLVVLNALRPLYVFLCAFVRKRRALPVRVRNIDLGALDMPAPPPSAAYRRHGRKLMLYLDVPVMSGGVLAVVTARPEAALLGTATAVALVLLGLLALLPTVQRCRKVPGTERTFNLLNRQLAVNAPEIALYFSYDAGPRDSAYQVNMWLESLRNLDRRAVIVLREVSTLRFLAYTSLPVVCVPRADDLSLLELPDVRVIAYPANSGKNVHMLRVPEAKHVFIGHGDSDKLASSNRVSKVYDEIWVAGEGGRARYGRVRHSVSQTAIREVGRPQLTDVEHVGTRPSRPVTTVLYAPTWEGWTADPYQTSLVIMGAKIVRMLLNRPDPVRIVYRPHPLTGRRSAEAEQAHRQIVKMLTASNKRHGAAPAGPDAADRLADLERRMGAAKEWTVAGVYGRWRKDRRVLSRPPGDDWHELQREWNRLYWSSRDDRLHQISTGQLPSLNAVFNESDLLISDVSSVVSDFLASEKPYAVTNPGGLDAREFTEANPAASAAYLLGPSCELLDEAVEAARGRGGDVLAERRAVLRGYLLGDGDPQRRFNEAVNRCYDSAVRLYPRGVRARQVIASPFAGPEAEPAPVLIPAALALGEPTATAPR